MTSERIYSGAGVAVASNRAELNGAALWDGQVRHGAPSIAWSGSEWLTPARGSSVLCYEDEEEEDDFEDDDFLEDDEDEEFDDDDEFGESEGEEGVEGEGEEELDDGSDDDDEEF